MQSVQAIASTGWVAQPKDQPDVLQDGTLAKLRFAQTDVINMPMWKSQGRVSVWTRRILPLALSLLGAGLANVGILGLYNPNFRIAHRWSGSEAALGGALMIWAGVFYRPKSRN